MAANDALDEVLQRLADTEARLADALEAMHLAHRLLVGYHDGECHGRHVPNSKLCVGCEELSREAFAARARALGEYDAGIEFEQETPEKQGTPDLMADLIDSLAPLDADDE